MKTLPKSPCPQCKKKDKTTTIIYDSGNVYTNTFCECGYKKGFLGQRSESSASGLIMDGMSLSVRNQRRGYEKDTLQPLKKDGTINKDFVQAHGTKSIEKELKVSKDAIRQNIERYG